MKQYSPYFQTLHDETSPTGYLGRGTHYSVLRTVVWQKENLEQTKKAFFLDFAIIWDEDHDERIICVLEKLYLNGLLSPVLIVGERKGNFHFIHDDDFGTSAAYQKIVDWHKQAIEIAESLEDQWIPHFGLMESVCQEIINDGKERTFLYLNNIMMLWDLGVKEIQ